MTRSGIAGVTGVVSVLALLLFAEEGMAEEPKPAVLLGPMVFFSHEGAPGVPPLYDYYLIGATLEVDIPIVPDRVSLVVGGSFSGSSDGTFPEDGAVLFGEGPPVERDYVDGCDLVQGWFFIGTRGFWALDGQGIVGLGGGASLLIASTSLSALGYSFAGAEENSETFTLRRSGWGVGGLITLGPELHLGSFVLRLDGMAVAATGGDAGGPVGFGGSLLVGTTL